VRYISHELRTPLNTAFLGLKLLSSELKASKCPKDMERYDTLCDVNLSCTAAVDILNDMLCYEKLQGGILGLNKENVFVLPFLKNCVTMFSAHARECGVTISMDGDTPGTDGVGVGDRRGIDNGTGNSTPNNNNEHSSIPLRPDDTIFIDKFKMDQVIRNLISNALKFTPRGGKVTIRGSFLEMTEDELIKRSRSSSVKRRNTCFSFRKFFRRKNSVGVVTDIVVDDKGQKGTALLGTLLVVVTDTGAGIIEKNLKRLFKEIVQFNPEKLQAGGGSGLGLWISRGIVDLHDGKISASSGGEGMGSSFSVEIPMVRWIPATNNFTPPSNPKASPLARDPSLPLVSPPLSIHLSNVILRTNTLSEPRTVFSSRPPESFRKLELLDKSEVLIPSNDTSIPPSDLLVVDDSSLNRKMLLKCLRAAGHVCTEAGDGLEAIEAVKKRIGCATGCHGKPFDAILMDFVMPNMDGPTATKEIRALGYSSPIFGLTGNGKCSDIWKLSFLSHSSLPTPFFFSLYLSYLLSFLSPVPVSPSLLLFLPSFIPNLISSLCPPSSLFLLQDCPLMSLIS
jgi:signal transduction histidine kinase